MGTLPCPSETPISSSQNLARPGLGLVPLPFLPVTQSLLRLWHVEVREPCIAGENLGPGGAQVGETADPLFLKQVPCVGAAGQWQPPEETLDFSPPYPSRGVLRACTCLGQVFKQVLAPVRQAWGSEGLVGRGAPRLSQPSPGDPSHTLLGWSPSCSPDAAKQKVNEGPERPDCGLARQGWVNALAGGTLGKRQ